MSWLHTAYQWEVLLRDRGWSQIWCPNRQFTDLFPLHGTTHVGGVIHHPNLGKDFTDHLSMTESRTTELSETTIATALVTALMLAAAM
jgi:hypothetical protein